MNRVDQERIGCEGRFIALTPSLTFSNFPALSAMRRRLFNLAAARQQNKCISLVTTINGHHLFYMPKYTAALSDFVSTGCGYIFYKFWSNKCYRSPPNNLRQSVYGGMSRFLASSNTAGKIVHSPKNRRTKDF